MAEEPQRYVIPDNYADGRSFMGYSYRNIGEGVLCALVVWKITQSTPFIPQVRIPAGVILSLIVFVVALYGIREESLTQFVGSYILYRRDRKIYHFRRAGYVEKKEREQTEREKDYARRKANGELTRAEILGEKWRDFQEKAKSQVYRFIQGDFTLQGKEKPEGASSKGEKDSNAA